MFLDGLLELGRVDEIGRAELPGPLFLIVIGINCDDFLCTVGDAALDDAKTDAPSTKDGTGGAFLDFGRSGRGTVTGGDTAAEKTRLVERSLGVDCDDGDVGDDYC